MKKKPRKALYWAPRILAILFTVFISLFALDVFAENYTFLETIVALFMHLIPTYILIASTWLAWKNNLAGGIAFIVIFIFFTSFFHTYKNPIGFFIISLPLLVIGLLFILNKYLN